MLASSMRCVQPQEFSGRKMMRGRRKTPRRMLHRLAGTPCGGEVSDRLLKVERAPLRDVDGIWREPQSRFVRLPLLKDGWSGGARS
jgi:hypothetical protein